MLIHRVQRLQQVLALVERVVEIAFEEAGIKLEAGFAGTSRMMGITKANEQKSEEIVLNFSEPVRVRILLLRRVASQGAILNEETPGD